MSRATHNMVAQVSNLCRGRNRMQSCSAWLLADRRGSITLEWTLVLALVALPMYWVIKVCLLLMVAHYRMTSFMETIPFP